MLIRVLGSGTGVPSLERNAPAYLLRADGLRLLVDCGSGTLLQLERAGETYRQIDAVFITHTHPDHTADLVPLIHALCHTPGFERRADLLVVGPPDVRTWLEHCAAGVLRAARTFDLRLVDMPDRLALGALRVRACATRHTDTSLAYRFEHGQRSIAFTGDAELDETLTRLCAGVDLLVADCSYPDELATSGHMSASDCGHLARKAGARHLLLSHLYPTAQPDAIRVTQAGRVFEGAITLAADLAAFDL